jgi:hypothetical protein
MNGYHKDACNDEIGGWPQNMDTILGSIMNKIMKTYMIVLKKKTIPTTA